MDTICKSLNEKLDVISSSLKENCSLCMENNAALIKKHTDPKCRIHDFERGNKKKLLGLWIVGILLQLMQN